MKELNRRDILKASLAMMVRMHRVPGGNEQWLQEMLQTTAPELPLVEARKLAWEALFCTNHLYDNNKNEGVRQLMPEMYKQLVEAQMETVRSASWLQTDLKYIGKEILDGPTVNNRFFFKDGKTFPDSPEALFRLAEAALKDEETWRKRELLVSKLVLRHGEQLKSIIKEIDEEVGGIPSNYSMLGLSAEQIEKVKHLGVVKEYGEGRYGLDVNPWEIQTRLLHSTDNLTEADLDARFAKHFKEVKSELWADVGKLTGYLPSEHMAELSPEDKEKMLKTLQNPRWRSAFENVLDKHLRELKEHDVTASLQPESEVTADWLASKRYSTRNDDMMDVQRDGRVTNFAGPHTTENWYTEKGNSTPYGEAMYGLERMRDYSGQSLTCQILRLEGANAEQRQSMIDMLNRYYPPEDRLITELASYGTEPYVPFGEDGIRMINAPSVLKLDMAKAKIPEKKPWVDVVSPAAEEAIRTK